MKYMVKAILPFIIITMLLTLPFQVVYADTEPRFIVDSYSFTEGQPILGGQATLSIVLKNMSSSTAVSNILLTYQNLDHEVIYPIDGNSNQVYISKVNAESEYQVDIPIGIIEEYSLDTAPVIIMLKYQDSTGQSYNNTSTIFLAILQEDTLKISSLSVAENAVVDTDSAVGVYYENNGINDIYNVTMNIEGDIPEEQKTTVLGDLAIGENKYLDYYIKFSKEGSQTVAIGFSYEDSSGNKYSLSQKEYTVNVTAQAVNYNNDLDTLNLPENKIGLSILEMCMAGAIAIILILSIAFISKSISKKKQYI